MGDIALAEKHKFTQKGNMSKPTLVKIDQKFYLQTETGLCSSRGVRYDSDNRKLIVLVSRLHPGYYQFLTLRHRFHVKYL